MAGKVSWRSGIKSLPEPKLSAPNAAYARESSADITLNKYQELVKPLGLDNITCKTDVGLNHKPGKESREYITVFLRGILAEVSNFRFGRKSDRKREAFLKIVIACQQDIW